MLKLEYYRRTMSMTVDALDLCITRISAAMVLNIQNKWVFEFPLGRTKSPQCWENYKKNANMFSCYCVIPSCVICHGGSHASSACLNENLHTKFIVFKWSLVHYHYSLTWPTSVFVRECGRNLADAVLQRSMSHFGRCRHCYSGALLSGSGHCCPFRVRAPVDFLRRRSIIGLRGFVFCQRVPERWPYLKRPRCNYTPGFNEIERGVYWFHVVRPYVRLSVRLWTKLCPLCIFHNTSQIHFIFVHLIKQLQKVCCV